MTSCRGEYCAAPKCTNNRGRCKHLSFFRFPRDAARCKRWVMNSNRVDLVNVTSHMLNNRYSLCADHFEESMFMNINDRNRLVHNAVPTLFDELNHSCLQNEKQIIKESSKTMLKTSEENGREDTVAIVNRDHMYSMGNTEVSISGNIVNVPITQMLATCTGTGDRCGAGAVQRYHRDHLSINQRSAWQQTDPPSRRDKVTSTSRLLKTVEELRLRKIIRRQCKQMTRMQKQIDTLQEKLSKATKSYKVNDVIEGSRHHLNGLVHSFFTSQLLLSSKKAQGKRWPDEVKKFVMSIYRTSPKAYRLLSKEFILPSKKSIRKVALAEGDSVENAINSVVESSFKEETILLSKDFPLCLEEATENKRINDESGNLSTETELAVSSTVENDNNNFQPLDDEILQLTDNILQASDIQPGISVDSNEHETILGTDNGLILNANSIVPVAAPTLHAEDGNIYPLPQDLQQILKLEIFHYVFQQT